MTRYLLPLAAVALAGCGRPAHLQYDFGRSYTQAFTAQADLTRPSVVNQEYILYGIEGTKIRLMVQEATTQQKQGTLTLSGGASGS